MRTIQNWNTLFKVFEEDFGAIRRSLAVTFLFTENNYLILDEEDTTASWYDYTEMDYDSIVVPTDSVEDQNSGLSFSKVNLCWIKIFDNNICSRIRVFQVQGKVLPGNKGHHHLRHLHNRQGSGGCVPVKINVPTEIFQFNPLGVEVTRIGKRDPKSGITKSIAKTELPKSYLSTLQV